MYFIDSFDEKICFIYPYTSLAAERKTIYLQKREVAFLIRKHSTNLCQRAWNSEPGAAGQRDLFRTLANGWIGAMGKPTANQPNFEWG